MKKCVLGDICTKIGSGATPTGGRAAYAEEGVSLIRSQNVLDLTFSYGGLAYLNDSQADKLKSVAVQPNDVLLNITGDSVARSCMVDEKVLPARVNQHVAIVRVKKEVANPYYIMLWLVWQKKRLLLLASNGATRHALTKEMIEELPIDLPTLAEQSKIALLLSTIDRKIALNRKRIATLEAMAKEIYDYWFVQFDFPDAHGRPYKSSGGAMVYNPDLKREIPKGWEVKSINDCGEFFRGVAYSHEDEKQCGENVVLVMRGNNIKSGHIVDDSDRVFIDKAIVGQDQLMTKFSVLFAMSSGSKEHVGKTAVYYDYPAMAAYGAFCSKYVPSDSYRYFMFNFLSSSTYRAFVKRICGGTGINNMKEEYFNVPLFALPGDIGQVRKFNELTATIYAQVYNCTQEMSKLMSLRDFLLPLLMNGQVKVA